MRSSKLETGPPPQVTLADGEAARRRRDRELTMHERLERVHHLCAKLASLKQIRIKHPS